MDVRERYEGLQTRLDGIDSDGCYFLSLLSVAEEACGRKIDLIDAVNLARRRKLVEEKFYVLDPCALLSALAGGRWTRKVVETLGEVKDNEYTVAKWRNERTGFTHFRRRYFDTLESSVTVKEGRIVGYYVFAWN